MITAEIAGGRENKTLDKLSVTYFQVTATVLRIT